jgi:hypothetical protein
MQLRKCVNHPYLFPSVEPEPFEMGIVACIEMTPGKHLIDASGKLWLLDRLLPYLQKHNHRVLVRHSFV